MFICVIIFAVLEWTGTFWINDDGQAVIKHVENNNIGLSAKLSFTKSENEKQTFRPGDPIMLDVLLKDYSKEPWSVDSRQMKLPESFVIKNSQGRILQSAMKITYPIFPVVEKQFEPGDEYRFRVNLLAFYPHVLDPHLGMLSLLTPDQYSVQAVFRNPVAQYSRQPTDTELVDRLWPDDLMSNVLIFTVRQLSEREISKEIRRITQLPDTERIKVIGKLGAMQAKQAVPTLIELASTDKSINVRIAALLALTQIGDISAVQDVERILLTDESSNVRAYAASFLGQCGLKRSVPVLIEALKNRKVVTPTADEQVGYVPYSAAIRALGDIGDPRPIPILTELRKGAC